jgi:hypothetical protein
MIPNKNLTIAGMVILALLWTATYFYDKVWFAGWNTLDRLQIEQQKRYRDQGIGRFYLAGRNHLGTATRTPAFGWCDKMLNDEWTCELRALPDGTFSTVKAEYERSK